MTDKLPSNDAKRTARWIRENQKAINAANAWSEVNGLPLARYRRF